MVGEAHAPPPPARRLDRDNAPPPPPTLLVPPPYDPALDAAIKQLLDQQAEIQAKLAQLLPQKYGPNIKVELDMLRHKLLVLEAYATDNRELLSLSLSLSLSHTSLVAVHLHAVFRPSCLLGPHLHTVLPSL
jgi:hypothetical protein